MNKTIECRASRRGEMWVASIPQHAVYGYGRTLKELHDNLTQGLALVDVTAHVTITPTSPELDRLRRAETAYENALADTVTTLATHGCTPRDVAEATGVPIARVKALRTTPAATAETGSSAPAGLARSAISSATRAPRAATPRSAHGAPTTRSS